MNWCTKMKDVEMWYGNYQVDKQRLRRLLQEKAEKGGDVWFCTTCKDFKNDDNVVSCKNDLYLLCEECGHDSEVAWDEYDPEDFTWK